MPIISLSKRFGCQDLKQVNFPPLFWIFRLSPLNVLTQKWRRVFFHCINFRFRCRIGPDYCWLCQSLWFGQGCLKPPELSFGSYGKNTRLYFGLYGRWVPLCPYYVISRAHSLSGKFLTFRAHFCLSAAASLKVSKSRKGNNKFSHTPKKPSKFCTFFCLSL